MTRLAISPAVSNVALALPELDRQAFSAAVARSAVCSLYAELVLYPKPGLVSLVDNGSHADMNAGTFFRSMFALRRYFALICQAGIEGAPFDRLKQLGIEAEARMLRATNGINTHRGAIFSLGMLCAAVGRVAARAIAPTAEALRAELLACWGDGLGAHTRADGALSNGVRAAKEHGASGAREEGALGFPSVFDVGLPVLRAGLEAGRGSQRARIDTLFALMARMSDTNVYHRAGSAGAGMVRAHAQAFIDAGGTGNPGWYEMALQSHRLFVAHRISPGGAADLLAATCLVHALTVAGE